MERITPAESGGYDAMKSISGLVDFIARMIEEKSTEFGGYV
jgi:hypothetical protein